MEKFRVLFVCMGNICRSPTAEGVMRKLVENAGLQHIVEVDSAGTHGYHVGEAPDVRTQAAASRRGYDLSPLRARQVITNDFADFDLLLAMDFNNLDWLQARCPSEHQPKVGMLMGYAREIKAPVVPDPYYHGRTEFDRVLDYVEDACGGLVLALTHHNMMRG